jgi:hypothetical protein
MSRPKLTLCSELLPPKEPPGNQGQHRRNCGEDCVLCNRQDGSLSHDSLALLVWLARQQLPPETWAALERAT